MNSERWQKLTDIVGECLDLPPQQRIAHARAAADTDDALLREVLEWLADAQHTQDFMRGATPAAAMARVEEDAKRDDSAWIGRMLGPYRLVAEIAAVADHPVFARLHLDVLCTLLAEVPLPVEMDTEADRP